MKKSLWLFLLIIGCGLSNIYADETKKLHKLFEEDWQDRMKQHQSLDENSDEDVKGRFAKVDVASQMERLKSDQALLKKLDEIDLEALSPTDKINVRIFRFQIEARIDKVKYETYLFPLEGDTGFYFGLLRLPDSTELRSLKQVVFYQEQLSDIENYLNQWKVNLELAIKKNKVLPSIVLVDFEKPLYSLLAQAGETSPFLKPLDKMGETISAGDKKKHRKIISDIIQKQVEPSIRAFIQFLKDEYVPLGTKSIAITDMADGEAYYQSQIRYYTTLDLSADDIHQIGLKEVKRIRKEMDAVIKDSGFKGTFAEFIQFLRTDPQFYAKSAEELLKEASYIAKKMDGQLPRFFKRLPRQPYAVEPVPDSIAPRYTTGRYVGAKLDSTQPGRYWVNTYALEKRPLYVLEALTLHEAVPGHHLQSALTQELDNLPNFRRYSYISAFGEGWALYCERLGKEAGFYQTAYSEFGRLTYEMWRAIRLVVDTGMHAKGWSRAKAIQFMESNTALSTHNVKTEIDRYISWPAQALSYKMGELKIVALRAKAEKELGTLFDLRSFHDAILEYGPVPLPVLDDQINHWIEQVKIEDKKRTATEES